MLLLTAVGLQPLSGILERAALKQLEAGTDTLSIWSSYVAGGTPDVLYIGDSRVRQDVDTAAISRQFYAQAGRNVSVAKIGLSNADAALLDAATYRALSLPRKPRIVVLAVSEFAFNAGYQPDRTDDYWQLSSPTDLGYMKLALDYDWNRTRLLEGWTVPLVANWPVIAEALQCDVRPSPSCTYAATQMHLDHMTQGQYDLIRSYFLDQQLRNFQLSNAEVARLQSAANRVRQAGARLALVVLPINGIAELDPTMYAAYLQRMQSTAVTLRAPFADLHAAVSTEDWSLWGDPSHLDDKGAASLAPQLAQVAGSAS